MRPNPDSTSAPGATSEGGERPAGRLPLVLTVAFTGHRVVKDSAIAGTVIAAAFADIGAAFERLRASELAQAYEGEPRLRLLVGGAPGTDRLAQEAWRAGSCGEIHAVYPFFDAASGGAATDDPAKRDPATFVDPGPEPGCWTGIDALGLGLTPEQAHIEVGRWLVRHADLLVAWWDGKPGRGLGGAHDTIRRALERGLPVVWLTPGERRARLISLASAAGQADAAEAVAAPDGAATDLTSERLAAILAPTLAPPGETGAEAADALARRDYARIDPTAVRPGLVGMARRLGDRTLWRTFRLFERVAGGASSAAPGARPPLPPDLAVQPGFRRLAAAADEAGARADRLSAIHRSEQLLLILIATLAVFFGALPALITAEVLPDFHVYAAAIEFALGVIAFIVAWAARRAHRHRRWSDARRLAERLKSGLATWPLGFDIADAHVAPAPVWTEWRARAVIRAAGPRRGWITRERFEATAAWAAGDLIDGQIDYHLRGRHTAENIERSLAWTENGAFAVLMATLAAYLWIGPHPPWRWFPGFVTLVSAFAPAVAAACLALEATNGFGELKERNARLAADFQAEKGRLGPVESADYRHACAVIRRAAQLRVDDADAWRDRLLRRRIVRGA